MRFCALSALVSLVGYGPNRLVDFRWGWDLCYTCKRELGGPAPTMSSAPINSCQRPNERFWIWRAGEATVEFTYPDGCHWCCDLLNISKGGVCFGLMDEQPALDSGLRIAEAVLRIAEVDIEGSLVVVHITESLSAGTVCGAEFMPATEDDRNRLTHAISQLEAKRRQPLESAPV